jgi:hypothetical protein
MGAIIVGANQVSGTQSEQMMASPRRRRKAFLQSAVPS